MLKRRTLFSRVEEWVKGKWEFISRRTGHTRISMYAANAMLGKAPMECRRPLKHVDNLLSGVIDDGNQ